jgi:hypothetical protein
MSNPIVTVLPGKAGFLEFCLLTVFSPLRNTKKPVTYARLRGLALEPPVLLGK